MKLGNVIHKMKNVICKIRVFQLVFVNSEIFSFFMLVLFNIYV